MGYMCAKCGTENREGSKFCKGCGALMATAPDPSAAEEASSNCPDCGTSNPAGSRFCKSCGCVLMPAPQPAPVIPISPTATHTTDRPVFEPAVGAAGFGGRKVALVGLLLAAAAVTAWFFWNQKNQASQPASPPSATLPAESMVQPETREPVTGTPDAADISSAPPPVVAEPAPVTPPPVVELAVPPDAAAAANAQSARLNQERLERERRERLMAQEQARAAQELERQRAEQTRRQAPSPAAPPAAQETAPAPALTVARICDASGNFITREVCRVRECLKASFANDPICVNFRKMEEANRARDQAY